MTGRCRISHLDPQDQTFLSLRGADQGRETRWEVLAILLVTESAKGMALGMGRREGQSQENRKQIVWGHLIGCCR